MTRIATKHCSNVHYLHLQFDGEDIALLCFLYQINYMYNGLNMPPSPNRIHHSISTCAKH